MNQIPKMLSLCTVTLLLAACSGGTTTDVGSLDAQKPVAITGQVQQGNIAGATVFLDLNGDGVKNAGEPAAPVTVADGKFTLVLTADDVVKLKANLATVATAKIVSDGGTDTTTGLAVGLLASDLPAINGATANKNITAMTTLTAMTPDAQQKADLKAVLGKLGHANDDALIETATPAVIALCKSVESALLNVQKSTSVEVAREAATEMGKALSLKMKTHTELELTDTQKLANTLSTAAGIALKNNKIPDAQANPMVTSIGKGCKDVADLVKSKTGGSLSTEDRSKKESEIMTELGGVGGQISTSVDASTAEVETHHSGSGH
jgi:hypothetical protein